MKIRVYKSPKPGVSSTLTDFVGEGGGGIAAYRGMSAHPSIGGIA